MSIERLYQNKKLLKANGFEYASLSGLSRNNLDRFEFATKSPIEDSFTFNGYEPLGGYKFLGSSYSDEYKMIEILKTNNIPFAF